jgi:hypothetical protein
VNIRRASFGDAQDLDGSDSFPHQNNTAREYRDEFVSTGIQPETSDADPRNRPAHESNQDLNSPLCSARIFLRLPSRIGVADSPALRAIRLSQPRSLRVPLLTVASDRFPASETADTSLGSVEVDVRDVALPPTGR